MLVKCLIGWAVFVALVYLFAWYDDVYYTHNLPEKWRKLRDTLTEE